MFVLVLSFPLDGLSDSNQLRVCNIVRLQCMSITDVDRLVDGLVMFKHFLLGRNLRFDDVFDHP